MGSRIDAAQDDGCASAARIDGEADRQFACDENERRIAFERIAVMEAGTSEIRPNEMIASAQQLTDLIQQIQAADRVALDTEADSLHSYREKLCLLQISVPHAGGCADFIVDPLSGLDLEPLRCALDGREIILHGADYDLRMLRRGLHFTASKVFDTVIAARLLGIREFSLGALVKRFFGIELHKQSQKANWALRPLPPRMTKYALNDVHYLLPLASILEEQLERCERRNWFRQSCDRAIEVAGAERGRNPDDLWRISGSGALDPRAGAVLRALWLWRDGEAEMADRPPFHILQNHELLAAAINFASGGAPDYKQFSARRRQAFQEAAKVALQSPQSEWPVMRRRSGSRPSAETLRCAEKLRERRDKSAELLGLEQSFIASRGALEAVAADPAQAETLLVPWQHELLRIDKESVAGNR
jgi:ribonuclease D